MSALAFTDAKLLEWECAMLSPALQRNQLRAVNSKTLTCHSAPAHQHPGQTRSPALGLHGYFHTSSNEQGISSGRNGYFSPKLPREKGK